MPQGHQVNTRVEEVIIRNPKKKGYVRLHTTHGEAVQVDPMRPMLKAPGTKRLKLKYHKLLSSFAFEFNLRRYSTATSTSSCTATSRRARWGRRHAATRVEARVKTRVETCVETCVGSSA